MAESITFQFPESTREKDLRPSESTDDVRRTHAVKVSLLRSIPPCNRLIHLYSS